MFNPGRKLMEFLTAASIVSILSTTIAFKAESLLEEKRITAIEVELKNRIKELISDNIFRYVPEKRFNISGKEIILYYDKKNLQVYSPEYTFHFLIGKDVKCKVENSNIFCTVIDKKKS